MAARIFNKLPAVLKVIEEDQIFVKLKKVEIAPLVGLRLTKKKKYPNQIRMNFYKNIHDQNADVFCIS
jgi:hypothetical protein